MPYLNQVTKKCLVRYEKYGTRSINLWSRQKSSKLFKIFLVLAIFWGMSIWFAEQLSFTRIVCVSMSKYTTHVSEKLLNYSNSLGYIRYLFFYWFFKQKGDWHEKVLNFKSSVFFRYCYLTQPLIYNLSVPTKKFSILKKIPTKINKKELFLWIF